MAQHAVPSPLAGGDVTPAGAADQGAGGLGAQVQRQWRRLQARLRSSWRPLTVALLAPPHVPGDAHGTAVAIDAALDALDAWAAAHEGVQVAVQLSSRWLLCCATPEAENAHQARELAQQQWAHYFGLEAEQLAVEWQVLSVVQGATQGGVRLVCAVPRALLAGLKDVARERGLSLQAAMPWWAEDLQSTWDAHLADHPATAQPEGQTCQWAWAEPGLRTQVSARVQAGRWVLTRLWSEVADEAGGTAAAPVATRVAQLVPPDATALVWSLAASPAEAALAGGGA